METKFTKGNWVRHINDCGYITSIRSEEEGRTIFTSKVNNMVESNANMVLAESAPEMFEMLKDLTEIVDGYLREQANNNSYPNYIIERNEKAKQLLTKITEQ